MFRRRMEFDPAKHSAADCYRMLIGLIVPRPIAIVGTCAADRSSVNLAPFSFFNGCGSTPMTLLFCPANRRDGGEKDSLRNAKPVSEGGQGEFTVSLCVESIVQRAVSTAEALAYGESEFELSGLAQRESRVVAPPGVMESPATFECRTVQVIRLAPGIAGGANIVIGQVVHLSVADVLLDEHGRLDQSQVRTVARMGGDHYCETSKRFELPMGRQALDLQNPFAS